jgi:hypothetical protein
LSAAAAEVGAVADTLVAELQAAAADAATATAGGGAAAASKLAAAVEAAEAAVGAAVLSDGSSVSLELLEEALHWHRYSRLSSGQLVFLAGFVQAHVCMRAVCVTVHICA